LASTLVLVEVGPHDSPIVESNNRLMIYSICNLIIRVAE